MSGNDITIKVENLSKVYRIGLKGNMDDSFAKIMFGFIASPLRNYRKYRALYKFDDLNPSHNGVSQDNVSDIIWALRDVSFNVRRGEVFGIIGRNGAGKSTLLKILSRITPPTSGRAAIRGRVSSLIEVGTGFHPELTGRENVYLNGTVLGMTKKEVDRKFDEIVEFANIGKFLDTPVKRYSSGMRVRLAFSVAAHLEPEILIIDEVLAVGDARFQKKCLNKMDDVGQQGRTVLFVSHNMPAITRLCQRALLLEEGRVIEIGSAPQVVKNYLSDGSSTPALREWPDPETAPGGEVARLRAVRILGGDGRITETIDIRRPVAIEMEFEVLTPNYVLMPYYDFFNEEGNLVFTSVDQDPTWRKRSRPLGRYLSKAWIPGNLLSEGMLYISAVLVTLNPDTLQFYGRDSVAFQVVDTLEGDSARGDWAGRMRGAFRPLLKWETKYTPSSQKVASD